MLSIITSLYNSEKYLPSFIKKIKKITFELCQKQIPHEFLIISNTPNEQEKEILQELQNYNDLSIKIIICDRESLYASWNRGIQKARFSIITFWSVDDERFSDAIIDGINLINKGAEIVYFPFIYKRYIKIFNISVLVKRIVINPPEFSLKTFTQEMHCGPFFITTQKSFQQIGFFDPTFKIAGDFDWCVRAAKSGLVFEKSNIIAGIFTNDGETLSGSKNKIQEQENSRIVNNIKK